MGGGLEIEVAALAEPGIIPCPPPDHSEMDMGL